MTGVQTCALPISCFLIAALLILPLGLPEELQSQQAESYGKTLKEGISFLRDSRRLLLLILLCGLLNAMLTPMQALQSALVKDIYQKGGETLSFMGAALSGGMLLGAFLGQRFHPSGAAEYTPLL